MNKQEKFNKIKNLSDIKRIRFNTGTLVFDILIIGMFLLGTMSFGFSSIFMVLSTFSNIYVSIASFLISILFLIIGYISLFLMIKLTYKQKKVEEEFLNEN